MLAFGWVMDQGVQLVEQLTVERVTRGGVLAGGHQYVCTVLPDCLLYVAANK